ncbi:MAG: AAA family ATPase [Sulfuricurvum sp.]|jgi:5-methylcytosine-specific restriction protein B|uniref:McrB family protein n=1 Tax=Sulfuricurvum sp. TaxID=2025608 RepID=UPI0025D92130|nr:AAA family ATPase [Sulfuricurvum sp.]MCK9371674.1 AAA family ATPase [Sulfuricurvum sp.]
MSKLNKIFYGPAGTGKTRRAIEEAVEIVKRSENQDNLNVSQLDTLTYDGKLKFFESISTLPDKLKITDDELLKDIHNPSMRYEQIEKKQYKGYSKTDLTNMKNDVLEYRLYPLIETVTFHPSYSYQDFVEGISVETTEKNQIIYKAKDGIFKKICDRAIGNPTYNYVLIIDEINRGDISSIFGELFTLLEDSKRAGEKEVMSINLPYSKDDKGNPKRLTVPKNLHIVATMNTVDKSIALIDVALRRRFDFIECMPDYDLEEFKKCKEVDLAKLLRTINERIMILKNEHYQIGHSYFLNIDNREKFVEVMKKSIIPLLQEYFYDDWKSICAVLNQSYDTSTDNRLFTVNQKNTTLFRKEFDELLEYQNKKIFILKETFTIEDIKSIYA